MVSLVASSQAVTRATVRELSSGRSTTISATSNAIRAPGRSTQARTFTGATGIGVINGVANSNIPVSIVQPTFLYEMIWDLLVAVLVVVVDRRLRLGHGRAFAVYVAGYAFGRFWIELMRSDPATHILGVRINVWVMSLLFVAAVAYYIVFARRGPREDPTTFGDYQLAAAADEPPVPGEPGEPGQAGGPDGPGEPAHAVSAAPDAVSDVPGEGPA